MGTVDVTGDRRVGADEHLPTDTAGQKRRQGLRGLADLTSAGLLSKTEVSRGKQGRYSLTELGIQTIPLLMALADWGAKIDPTTAARKPGFTQSDNDDALSSTMEEVRRRHLATGGESVSTSLD